MPGHNYVYAPALRRAKQHLEAGDYGKLSAMWMMFNLQVGEDWGHAYGRWCPSSASTTCTRRSISSAAHRA